ncbi:MAG: DUF4007 family protein [bacterium]
MSKASQTPTRLPRNFHKTFIPERQYIHAMLRYAASGKAGDYQEISAVTGIPTGVSSGKVPAILDYCRGMGLVRLAGGEQPGIKRPELTPFGRIVLLEDPYLKERVTQWIAHFNLCGPLMGADVWYYAFFDGTQALGMSFPREKLAEYLALVYSTQQSGLIGPLVRMYEDEASFKNCGVLSSDNNDIISRQQAPTADEFGFAYGAWMLQLMDEHFPKVGQVTVTELDAKAGWRTIPGWDISNVQRVLYLIERKGIIEVDRHMDPWILRRKATAEEMWCRIYNDLI